MTRVSDSRPAQPAPAATPAADRPAAAPGPVAGQAAGFAQTGVSLASRKASSVGMPDPAQPPVPTYQAAFGARSYVEDGADATFLGLARRAVAASPELAGGPVGQAVAAGRMGPGEVSALQRFLGGKGLSVGPKGVDGKYGPDTHAALKQFLSNPPAEAPPAKAPAPQTPVRVVAAPPAAAPASVPAPQAPTAALTGEGRPITNPPGQGEVHTAPGANSPQTAAALKAAGGIGAIYKSAANGGREVAVLASPGFDPSKPYKVLVYNHGMRADNALSLGRDHLDKAMKELNEAGGNTLLVLPRGPEPVHGWFHGKDDLGAIAPEAIKRFSQQTGIPLGKPAETNLMMHSAGGKGLMWSMQKPNAPHFDKILFADTFYGDWAGSALANIKRRYPGTQIAGTYTPHTGREARGQMGTYGLRAEPMPGSHGSSEKHQDVPAYMIRAYLSPEPPQSFSKV